jgi:NAD(P)-dependent dehydrogenase (short-subunit alcohol dehydrogenase family)
MSDAPQTVLVTGAARRVGRCTAELLAAAGWRVAVHYRSSAEAAAEVVCGIEAAGGAAFAIAADLAEEAEAAALIDRVADQAGGPVTALVNNAAVFEHDTIANADRARWDRHMAVNLRAPFVLSQRFAAALPADARGAIVNIVDERALNPSADFVTYTLSKSGLWTLTLNLAIALAPRIRVNGVGPGATLRDQYQADGEFERVQAALPLGHGATPDDIAEAVRFLLAAPAVTGQMIAVDGGAHMAPIRPSQEVPET